ncbi:hypothetical protein BKA82DRAFT_2562298 [Pisolithus tinctorius]|nr:hypothetical protein BKA82DRAFT_2562298 [Pisolithus tinctorius]
MISKKFEHPFDLVKVRLQSQVPDPTARFNGRMDCLLRWYSIPSRGQLVHVSVGPTRVYGRMSPG